jgi:ABC-type amino acid transport substrate-binding protein
MKLLSFALLLVLTQFSWASSEDIVFTRQNSEPKYLPNTQGLCDQIYGHLAKRLASSGITTRVDAEAYPIKRILKLMEAEQAQVFCGAGKTESRKKQFGFSSVPVYQVSYVVVAHEDETVIPESFEEFETNGIELGVFYGTSSGSWVKDNTEVKISDNHHSLDNVTKMMANRELLKYFYYHDLGLNYYIEKHELPLKVLPTRFRVIPQWLIYSKNLPVEIREKLDTALEEITESGQLQKIQDQFLSPPSP